MNYTIRYNHDDCLYEVIAPLGVTIIRTPTEEQAASVVRKLCQGDMYNGGKEASI